jgi:hypothetical protein
VETSRRFSDNIPPLPRFWSDPVFQTRDPFFGGQAIDQLYIRLANQIPVRYISPLGLTAQGALTLVMNRAVSYAADQGSDGLQPACAQWLAAAADELHQWVSYGDMAP